MSLKSKNSKPGNLDLECGFATTLLFFPVRQVLALYLKFTPLFFVLWYWGLNSGPMPRATLLFVMGFFLRYCLTNYLSRLALNSDPPDLCLLSG
jgi:hypothetical protein